MAIQEQTPDHQITPTRPTPERVMEAREWFAGDGQRTLAHLAANYPESYGAIITLLAATEPPPDKEIVERYNAFLKRKGWEDRGNAIWFADGVEAFIGRKRAACACGKCPVKP